MYKNHNLNSLSYCFLFLDDCFSCKLCSQTFETMKSLLFLLILMKVFLRMVFLKLFLLESAEIRLKSLKHFVYKKLHLIAVQICYKLSNGGKVGRSKLEG